MKKVIIGLIVFTAILSFPPLAAAENANRGFIFQFGVGAGFPSYPSALEATMSYADSLPGIARTQVSLDLALGYAVSQQIYLLGRADGIGDRISDSYGDYVQVNLYLYSVGLRFYPWTTGVYLEGSAGASSGVSDFGFGYGAAIGYDFTSNPRGFGLTVEAKYDGLQIEERPTRLL